MLTMQREADRFGPPIRQSIERSDAQPAESRSVRALCSVQPPIEIALRSCRVDLFIYRAVVRLLVNHQPFGTRFNQRTVLARLHWPNFQRDGWKFLVQHSDAIAQVIARNKFRMFPSHEQNVPKPLPRQLSRFAADLIDA